MTVVPPAASTPAVAGGGDRRDFFVSYAGPDRPWARWVAALLEADGFRVEIDEWDWPPGCDVVQRMNLALENADRVLALWSARYFDPASWAGEELSAAMHRRHEHKDRLVPVLIEKFDLGPLYRPLLQVDLTGVQEQEASRLLLDRLRGHTGRGRHHPFPGVLGQGKSQAEVGGRFPGVRPPVWRVPARNPGIGCSRSYTPGLAVLLRWWSRRCMGWVGSARRSWRWSTPTGSHRTTSWCGGSTRISRR